MPRVLILSAPYGSGYERVAAALAHAFAEEGAYVDTVDHFERFVPPAFVRTSLGLFWTTLRWAPSLWGLAYALSARLRPCSPAMSGMDRLGAGRLAAYLSAAHPDVVVHVHPTPAGAMSWLRGRGRVDIPHGIVLTDFVAHPQWICPDLDRYFVPTDEVAGGVRDRGVLAEHVVVSGIPIAPAFAMPADRAALRGGLGLEPDTPAVLVTGGMRGALGGIGEVCGVLATLPRRLAAVVVCGDHAQLARRLRARFASDARFRVLGRVSDMHRLMGAVDIVVTKAGAVTCAEALALERPLVFYRSLPGQERVNETCLERAGVGIRASSRTMLRRHLETLLAEPARRAALAGAARRLRRPEAARTVAKEMLALAGGRGNNK